MSMEKQIFRKQTQTYRVSRFIPLRYHCSAENERIDFTINNVNFITIQKKMNLGSYLAPK